MVIEPEKTVFIALRTKVGDGHAYITEMYRKGVRNFVVETVPEGMDRIHDARFYIVEDSTKWLQEQAKLKRKALSGKTIAITGSTGKTVLKELLAETLERLGGLKVEKTPGSYNSALGVPLGILSLENGADYNIVEAGIDGEGQMAVLEDIIRPNIGILTSITTEHDAGFSSREKKIREKISLFRGCETIFYPGDDKMAEEIVKEQFADRKLIPFIAEGEMAYSIACKLADYICREDISSESVGKIPLTGIAPDVDESENGCVLLRDNFTADKSGLISAIESAVRRKSSRQSLTMICGPLNDISERDLEVVAKAMEIAGITKFYGAGKSAASLAARLPEWMAVKLFDSEASLTEEFDASMPREELILLKGNHRGAWEELRKKILPSRHDTWMDVNLSNLIYNYNLFRNYCGLKSRLICMVKASAYGLGSLEVARSLQSAGAAMLAVAVVEEGVKLRRGGISMPIVVLNPITTDFHDLFAHDLQPTIFSFRELEVLKKEALKAGVENVPVHVKLDTGMHRLGFLEEELEELSTRLKNAEPILKVATVFSHLATADETSKDEYTHNQIAAYNRMADGLEVMLGYKLKRHLCNTAGICRFLGGERHDFGRLGIGLYGISPFGESETTPELKELRRKLKPVATLNTTVISIKRWPTDTPIGYGNAQRLERPSTVATLPIGYADGVDRSFGCGRAKFIVNGRACPTVGNICMDLCMIDVSEVPGVKIGDRVEIFGPEAPVESLAKIRNTIPYEIISTISPRVKRIYRL